MKLATKAGALSLLVALGACTDAGRFGAGGDVPPGGFGTGAPIGAPPVTASPIDPSSPQYFNQTVGDRVLFAVDQSTISETGRQTLIGQAQWLMANPAYTAIIEGHADEQGTREYNLALGERRASAVRTFLVAQGVPAARLRTVTYGKERPIEVCSTEACYAKNRRAVTVIAAGPALS
ncbi:peptidoglycan-associated lipoprotein Pal [Rhodobacteraceae bacterium CCMM004]|nr:peptidoglycan-associated lipoprotein Pal [Rhodobacteraceae bacterium CCMM004]